METNFTRFEKELIDMLLVGEDPVLSLLRRQLSNATIHSRQQTRVGFYLSFEVSEETPRIIDEIPSAKPDFCFGDVDATITGLQNGASFLIWVKSGRLKELEGYTYGEEWPTELTDYVLRYRDGSRNIAALRKEWLLNQL